MSGGIDSSAVCLMLLAQGYKVVGLTMRVWDLPRQFTSPGQEYPDFIMEAKSLADRLGIPHHVADERAAFKDVVVRNFIDEYLEGRTPNPCVMCNPLFKFRVLVEWADKLGCDFIATGHYVRLKHEAGRPALYCGLDARKDQSYFLWRVGQDVLSRCIFPLGEMRKEDVRDYLEREGFCHEGPRRRVDGGVLHRQGLSRLPARAGVRPRPAGGRGQVRRRSRPHDRHAPRLPLFHDWAAQGAGHRLGPTGLRLEAECAEEHRDAR